MQTNSLPGHCINSTVNYAVENNTEWSVLFNVDVTAVQNYGADDLDTSEKTDEILCDINRTSSSNMLAESDY